MNARPLPIAGSMLVLPDVHADARGSFQETYSSERYAAAGIHDTFVQDNVSLSDRDVLRGLHGTARMAKLVHVLAGAAFDVIADGRPGSPTYGRWHGEYLRAGEHRQIYVPAGCLHGFLALEDDTMLGYKQSALYDPAAEVGVAWNDPTFAIAWPLDGRTPRLSPKDASNPLLPVIPSVGA